VLVSTGTGLKDVPAAIRAVEAAGDVAHHVSPRLDAVEAVFGTLTGGHP
jgi:hypothetical protein